MFRPKFESKVSDANASTLTNFNYNAPSDDPGGKVGSDAFAHDESRLNNPPTRSAEQETAPKGRIGKVATASVAGIVAANEATKKKEDQHANASTLKSIS